MTWAASSIKLKCGCVVEHSVSVEKIIENVTGPGEVYVCPSHGKQTVTRVSGIRELVREAIREPGRTRP